MIIITFFICFLVLTYYLVAAVYQAIKTKNFKLRWPTLFEIFFMTVYIISIITFIENWNKW